MPLASSGSRFVEIRRFEGGPLKKHKLLKLLASRLSLSLRFESVATGGCKIYTL